MSEEKKKETKEKVVLTPEQKEEKLAKRLSDDLATFKIAFGLKDEASQQLILSKLKGKFPQKYVDDNVTSGNLTKKQAEKLKELQLIGAVRTSTGGSKGKSEARPWRYQIDVPKDGPTGLALIAFEQALEKLEDEQKDNIAIIEKWYMDNEQVKKTFATYFAKVTVKEKKDGEEGKDTGNSGK